MYSPEQSSPSGFSNSWGREGGGGENTGLRRAMVLLINTIPIFLMTVPQSQSNSHPKALDLAITAGLKGSQTRYAAPLPPAWIEGERTCWRLPPDLESPHAPHLEADIAPFATQTGEEEEDEGQQARAGNEDHGIGRSQRGPAQGESICGHRTGLRSRLQGPGSRIPCPSSSS